MRRFNAILLAICVKGISACTNVLVTPGASKDGSAMIAYNSDAGTLMGMLYHYNATEGNAGKMRKIYNWETGIMAGEIPEANQTYNVVGNVNEHGLCIGESTFYGLDILASQPGAIMDYGSLIYITLQRCRTALEAIQTMIDLMDTYGYASQGESFSIADRSGEVWIMEVIGRGDNYNGRLGAAWVARKLPNGFVSAHANEARITTFPRDDPDNCIYSDDVVDLAVHYGLYPATSDPELFSFSDVYNPITFMEARGSGARVWAIFSAIMGQHSKFQQEYADFAAGRNPSNRLPLWIKPKTKVTPTALMAVMANHFEGTELDSSVDVGGGMYSSPNRPRPVEWDYQGKSYHIERNIAVPQTGWTIVAQLRPWMPRELSALVWFAVDDSSTSPRFPYYGGSTRASLAYFGKGVQDGVMIPLLKFDMTKAFWVQNMVSNLAYSRWSDIYPVVRAKIDSIQADFAQEVSIIDKKAVDMYDTNGVEDAVEFVTMYSVQAGDKLHKDWTQFYGELFVRFRDFYDITPNPDAADCGCDVKEVGMPEHWKARIVQETGDHYLASNVEADSWSGFMVDMNDVLMVGVAVVSLLLGLWVGGRHRRRSFGRKNSEYTELV